jgi:hypothetical protein
LTEVVAKAPRPRRLRPSRQREKRTSEQDRATASGEEIDEQGRSATQQRIDKGASRQPVDVPENEPSLHDGEEGQEPV